MSSRSSAVDFIEQNVQDFQLDCDFRRIPSFLYSSNEKNADKIDKEYETALEAGVIMEVAANDEVPFEMVRGMKVERQAQFNAMRYVQGLANAVESDSCRIYENTRVQDFEESEDKVMLHTTGGIITAKYAVQTTHMPKGVKIMFHTVLGPYREYGVAAKLNSGEYPEGIFWGYYGAGEKVSIRSYSRGSEKFIIAVVNLIKLARLKIMLSTSRI